MIHLDNIPPRGDMRNYPWQRLVNAVRRACNISVTSPLVMTQSMSGTVIGWNPPFVPAGYARYNDSSAGTGFTQELATSTTATVEYDTLIHDRPGGGVFSWHTSNHELTIKVDGLYAVSSIINMNPPSTDEVYDFYAEKNAARILGAWRHQYHGNVNQTSNVLTFTEYFEADDVLRFRVSNGSSSDVLQIYSEQGGNYPPRFDVFRVG